jgi:hypothetical protein
VNDERSVAVVQSGLEVRLVAPGEVVSDVSRTMRPFVTVRPAGGNPGAVPVVEVHDGQPSGSGWRRVVTPSEYEPDRVVWADDRHRRIAVVGKPSDWLTLQVVRSIRYLLRWQAYARGDLLLHGGLVEAAGFGIVFAGGKRSGKTSSVLSLLAEGASAFVSNDDITISDTAGGLFGYGSPRTVKVRTDALLALLRSVPALGGLLSGLSHPTNAYAGRHHTVEAVAIGTAKTMPGSLWVRCAELAAVTGCVLRAEAPVHAVVFPSFDAAVRDPAIRLLSGDTALAALSANVESQATKYDDYLPAWFPETNRARREQLTTRLLREVPCFALTQRMDDLPRASRALLDAVGAGQACDREVRR